MGLSRRIGDIQIFAELARGPLTVVSKGYESTLDRFVLLKVLHPEVAQDDTMVSRLEDEARLVARIQHENVVAVYSYGREGDTAYIATEFVEGFDLQVLISRRALPVDIAVFILKGIVRGLRAAHGQRVYHRDLKPSNVMISFDGQVKITDFGFASLMDDASEEIRGTASYLAPEQVRGDSFVPASDLFAIGAIFFEMLSGHLAFVGATTGDILDAILNDSPGNRLFSQNNIPTDVASLCNRLLEKDPDARFTTAAEVFDALNRLDCDTVTPEILEHYIAVPHEFISHSAGGESVTVTSSGELTARETRPGPVAAKRHRMLRRAGQAAVVITVFGALFIVGLMTLTGDNPGADRPVSLSGGAEQSPAVSIQPSGEIIGMDVESSGTGAPPSTPPNSSVGEAVRPQPVSSTDGVTGNDAGRAGSGQDGGISRNPTGAAPEEPEKVLAATDTIRLSVDHNTLEPLTSATGQLVVDSVPWATVFIDGDSVATTPLRAPISIPSGTHAIILRHPEFPDYSTFVDVAAGQTASLSVSLFSLVGQVYLEISPWAVVFIDEAVRDTIPPQERPIILAAGEYSLRLRHPSLGTWETSILVEAGTTQRLRFNLHELLSQ